MTTDAGTVTPGAIWSVVYGYTAYWTVVAAIRLGIFDRLADGPLTLPELGTACDAPPDRLVSVAGALVAIGLLDVVHRHLGDVNETFDAVTDLHERAERYELGDASVDELSNVV